MSGPRGEEQRTSRSWNEGPWCGAVTKRAAEPTWLLVRVAVWERRSPAPVWGSLAHLDRTVGFFREPGIPAPELQAPFIGGLVNSSVDLRGAGAPHAFRGLSRRDDAGRHCDGALARSPHTARSAHFERNAVPDALLRS